MSGKKLLMHIAVSATLAAFRLCAGHAGSAGVDEESAVPGCHHLRSLSSGGKLEPAAQTRPGSLVFKHDQQGDLNSTYVKDVLAAKLKHMDPSVKCGDNSMTLTVKPTGASHFLVDSGQQPLTPLSQMPSTCGFSMKRSRRDVQYSTSYQGCHVDKKDGDYTLPLRLWGAPMSMSCPDMLPIPHVFCFPTVMVVKIGGVPAKELSVKMSGTWHPLSLAYRSCGLVFQEFPGELALIVPYSRGSCIEIKDEEYTLSLNWADFELLATCPPVVNSDAATGTYISPDNGDQVPEHPQYPHFSVFPQYMEPLPTHKPTLLVPQQFSFAAADSTENQELPKHQHPAYSFKPQLPQIVLFPRPELPMELSKKENPADTQVQLHEIPSLPQIPMIPGIFQGTTPSSPAPSNEPFVTTPAQTTEDKGKSQVTLLRRYPFLPFIENPSTEDKTEAIQHLKPEHLHPQTFQIPVLYPPFKSPSSGQSTLSQTSSAATTLTSPTTTEEPPNEKPFYHPHAFMPVYLIPNQASVPSFDSPATNSGPSEQQHQSVFHAMPPLFFPS
ncbi:cyclin-K-like [Cololabis saira]|uniref:cyclin-K-like n=1 Tax=Cololabis saira TaxID=129043 RepID=UPI002AD40381|nr:cyclin-K-like [Cololabis saira]